MILLSMRMVINESKIMDKGKHSDANRVGFRGLSYNKRGKKKTSPVVTGMVNISVGCGW